MNADRGMRVACRWVPANASRDELARASKTTLTLRVDVDAQVLLCYRVVRDSDDDDDEGKAKLMHTLQLATATASLLPGSNKIVSLGAVDPATRKMLHRGGDEGREGASQVQGEFYFKCGGEVEAWCLLGKMQQAGCIMRCLRHRYDIKEQVGDGGFAKVFSAVDKLSRAPVAIKLISTFSDGTHPLKEAAMLQRLRHPNLLDFKGVYYVDDPELLRLAGAEGDHVWALVTELLDGMDLHTLSVRRDLKEAEAQLVARQLLSALDYIHQSGIVHRDVKPENVVVTRKGAKLIDFGIASHVGDHNSMACSVGSAGYVAPEMLSGNRGDRTTKMDVFAMGSLLYFVMCGRSPFVGDGSQSMLANNLACEVDVEPLGRLSSDAAGFVCELLEADPDDRMSASQALLHPWLTKGRAAPRPPSGPRARPAFQRRGEDAGGSQDAARPRSAGAGGGGLAAIRSQQQRRQLEVRSKEALATMTARYHRMSEKADGKISQ